MTLSTPHHWTLRDTFGMNSNFSHRVDLRRGRTHFAYNRQSRVRCFYQAATRTCVFEVSLCVIRDNLIFVTVVTMVDNNCCHFEVRDSNYCHLSTSFVPRHCPTMENLLIYNLRNCSSGLILYFTYGILLQIVTTDLRFNV